MKNALSDMRLLQNHAPAMDKLFRTADLAILFQAEGKPLHNRISYLVNNQLLTPICRGLYGTEGWSLDSVSARLYPDSFITGPTILAEQLMIGTIPSYQLFCVKTGLPRSFELLQGHIDFHSIRPELAFGFKRQGFVNKADPERALVDTLYYHLRGVHYFFDLFSDVKIHGLNYKIFKSYISHFKNKKFQVFANDYYLSRN
jgi:hypothetical protein